VKKMQRRKTDMSRMTCKGRKEGERGGWRKKGVKVERRERRRGVRMTGVRWEGEGGLDDLRCGWKREMRGEGEGEGEGE
jgi:hypothetical protein